MVLMVYTDLFCLSLAVGILTLLITQSLLFINFRLWAVRIPLVGDIVHCPFCTSFWISFFGLLATYEFNPSLIAVTTPVWLPAIVTWLCIVGISNLAAFIVYWCVERIN